MAEILIPTNDARVQYTAAGGETSFAYDFPIFDQAHLVMIKTDLAGVDTTFVITTNYTVTGVGVLAGGDANLVVAAVAGEIFTLYRDVPEARNTDFQQSGDFLAADINRELDLITMALQQLRRDFDRSAILPASALDTVSATLPSPQANLLLGWSSDGLTLENKADIGTQTVSGYMATLLGSSSEAALKIAMNAEAGIDYQALLAVPSQAEAEAGMATTERVWTAQRVAQAIAALESAAPSVALSQEYISGEQAITSAGALTLAHGLTVANPYEVAVRVALICKTAEYGYSVGDVLVQHIGLMDTSSQNAGLSVVIDGTNLNVRFGSSGAGFIITNKTTGASSAITNANWKIRFIAYV